MSVCHKVGVPVFSDYGRSAEKVHMRYIAGMFLTGMKERTFSYLLSWYSHKSQCILKDIGPEEVLEGAKP